MTVREWILFGFLSLCIIGVSIDIGLAVEGKASLVFTLVVAFVLMITFVSMQLYSHGCRLTEDSSPCHFCSDKECEEK